MRHRKRKRDDRRKNKLRNVSAGLWAGGLGVTSGSVGLVNRALRNQKKSDFYTPAQRAKAKAVARRHGYSFRKDSVLLPKGWALVNPSSGHPIYRGKSIYHHNANKFVLDHEIGHVVASKKRFSANRASFKAIESTVREKNRFVRRAKEAGLALSRPFGDLFAEAEASYGAVKAAKKRGGWKEARRALKFLAPAYGTYVGRAAATAGVLGLTGHFIRKGMKKKNRKNRRIN